MKKCRICGLEKELEKFSRLHDGLNGRQEGCKDCVSLYMKKYYAERRDIIKFKVKQYRQKNKAKINIQKKFYWENKNPEGYKRFRFKERLKRANWTFEHFKEQTDLNKNKCSNSACNNLWEDLDHNHITNKPRSLLCSKCNAGLGMIDDDPKKLQGLIDYLAKWK